MQAKLSVNGTKNLYAFWGDKLYQEVFRDREPVINLASSEYSRALTPYLKEEDTMVTVGFFELVEGKPVSRGTYAKTARGEMVRWMAERKIEQPEDIRSFTELGYRYENSLSNEKEFIFVR